MILKLQDKHGLLDPWFDHCKKRITLMWNLTWTTSGVTKLFSAYIIVFFFLVYLTIMCQLPMLYSQGSTDPDEWMNVKIYLLVFCPSLFILLHRCQTVNL
jgi:hypothetical protein